MDAAYCIIILYYRPKESTLSSNKLYIVGVKELAGIQEENKSSNIESNDSTSKHEYEYMSLGRREGGDCSTLTHDIDSKMNPAYFSVQKEAHDYEVYDIDTKLNLAYSSTLAL